MTTTNWSPASRAAATTSSSVPRPSLRVVWTCQAPRTSPWGGAARGPLRAQEGAAAEPGDERGDERGEEELAHHAGLRDRRVRLDGCIRPAPRRAPGRGGLASAAVANESTAMHATAAAIRSL